MGFLQFIASTPTLFPAEYVKEFQSCLDKTPPVPFEDLKAIIRKELGRPLEEVYDFIDPQPLASASIAQVKHLATCYDFVETTSGVVDERTRLLKYELQFNHLAVSQFMRSLVGFSCKVWIQTIKSGVC